MGLGVGGRRGQERPPEPLSQNGYGPHVCTPWGTTAHCAESAPRQALLRMGKAGQHRNRQHHYGSTKKKVLVKGAVPKKPHKPTKLRKSLTPGTILILLAGRFRGRRVVFLKQLESGLLLVTGPYKVNGVPLRRCNHRYVIATSTKVDVSSIDCSAILDDQFKKNDGKKKRRVKKKKTEDEFFAVDTEVKGGASDEKKAAQNAFDKPLIDLLDKDIRGYLRDVFTLRDKMYPHEMRF
eukprot:CAMPEP_0171058566 /NCGR_PEP_ID=MMETSP0766_2-20121228/2568_1 /TAXON_ID=439317 /ORGANISM="Gambierdiscus australes, Strain CAWD 149" /LENGTH=236 /DNA_ID=CAMNT_0011513859 /DNA_START=360 /DNA_END=1070 /DNA_ORIENTATION=-